MTSGFKGWLEDTYFTWGANCYHLREMAQQVRGIARDREGRRYWRYVYEYVPGHFNISLHPWPGLTASSDESAGWISVGVEKSETSWTIYDVRVDRPRYRQRGIGTTLVQAAIALASARGGTQLWGWLMDDDVQAHPFLPEWYERLGFTVEGATGGDAIARITLDLHAHNSKHEALSHN
jgi:GNAT superfamily N-acetyltransferase